MAQRKVRALARRRSGIAGLNYFNVMTDLKKPTRRRKQLVPSNDEQQSVRRFHIPEDEIDEYGLLHESGDPFPNPHRQGWYHYIIEGLKTLGLDQRHEWPVFSAKVKELMSDPATKDAEGLTHWDRSLGPDAPDDREDRLLQNVQVLQRLSGMTPYGLRITQIAQRVLGRRGGCIDLEVWGDKLYVRLNLRPQIIQIPTGAGEMMRIPVPINEVARLRASTAEQSDTGD